MPVVLVTGLPGAGKTTLATNLGRVAGWRLLSRDAVKGEALVAGWIDQQGR